MIYEQQSSRREPPINILKQNARMLLSCHNVLLKLIYGVLICAATYIMIEFALTFALYNFVITADTPEMLVLLWDNIGFLIKFIMLSPLFIGFFALAASLSNDCNIRLSVIFHYYSSLRAYFKAVLCAAIAVLPLKLCILAFQFISNLITSNSDRIGTELSTEIYFLFIISAVAIFIALFFLYGKIYPFVNSVVCGGSQSLRRCLSASFLSTRHKLGKIFVLRLSFLGWILLSFCTVGVLFVVFTLPYMAVTYSQYSSFLLTGEYRIYNSEDLT